MAATVTNNMMAGATTVKKGYYTSSTSNYVSFEHNLGFVPEFIVVYWIGSGAYRTHFAEYTKGTADFYVEAYQGYWTTKEFGTTYQSSSTAYKDETKCSIPYYSSSYPWPTSVQIYWIAGKF